MTKDDDDEKKKNELLALLAQKKNAEVGGRGREIWASPLLRPPPIRPLPT